MTFGGIPECFCDIGWEGDNCNVSVLDNIHGMLGLFKILLFSSGIMHLMVYAQIIFLVQVRIRTEGLHTHPRFDPTGLQIMTVIFLSLR